MKSLSYCVILAVCGHFGQNVPALWGGGFITLKRLADLHAGGCRDLCISRGRPCSDSVAEQAFPGVSIVAMGARRDGGCWRWPNTEKVVSRVIASFSWAVSWLCWWTFNAPVAQAVIVHGSRRVGRGSGGGHRRQARCCAWRARQCAPAEGLLNEFVQARHSLCGSAKALQGRAMSWNMWYVVAQVMPTCRGVSCHREITRNHPLACMCADMRMMRRRACFAKSHSEK